MVSRSLVSRGLIVVCLGTAALAPIACGGGGGGGGSSSSLPVAPDPTCGSVIAKAVPTAVQIAQRFGGTVIVPESSVPRADDIGVRAHTNHLILAHPSSTRAPDPSGFTPSQLQKAYNIPSSGGSNAIAVVDAYNYATALNDFNVYANQFSLPPETSADATSSSNAVFQVVYASGTKPQNDASWAQESALDMEMVHAMAPNAKVYLVEAASSSLDDLGAAVNVAKKLPGVRQVSTSFGSIETGCDYASYDKDFVENGVTFFCSSGDDAGNVDYPGGSKNVVSVGGTSLNVNFDGSWASETVWNGASCGPSAFEPRPSFQNPEFSLVGKYRGAVDIAADADPNTGVSVYDSTSFQGEVGWQVYGGTSSACPMVAAIANVANVSHSSSQVQNATLYGHLGSASFHDVTSGSSSGFSAASGWDFPTGVGSPHGTSGF